MNAAWVNGVVGALLGSSVVAQAECPGAADLVDGVRFEMAGGASWTVQSAGGADRRVQFVWDPGFPTQIIDFHNGAYLTRMATETFVQEVTYSTALRRAPRPAPGAQWAVTLSNSGPSGTTIPAVHQFGAPERVRLGVCDYEMVPLTIQQGPAAEAPPWRYQYFPEFGTVVIVADAFGTTWQVTGVRAQ